jgi:hypothetical protein
LDPVDEEIILLEKKLKTYREKRGVYLAKSCQLLQLEEDGLPTFFSRARSVIDCSEGVFSPPGEIYEKDMGCFWFLRRLFVELSVLSGVRRFVLVALHDFLYGADSPQLVLEAKVSRELMASKLPYTIYKCSPSAESLGIGAVYFKDLPFDRLTIEDKPELGYRHVSFVTCERIAEGAISCLKDRTSSKQFLSLVGPFLCPIHSFCLFNPIFYPGIQRYRERALGLGANRPSRLRPRPVFGFGFWLSEFGVFGPSLVDRCFTFRNHTGYVNQLRKWADKADTFCLKVGRGSLANELESDLKPEPLFLPGEETPPKERFFTPRWPGDLLAGWGRSKWLSQGAGRLNRAVFGATLERTSRCEKGSVWDQFIRNQYYFPRVELSHSKTKVQEIEDLFLATREPVRKRESSYEPLTAVEFLRGDFSGKKYPFSFLPSGPLSLCGFGHCDPNQSWRYRYLSGALGRSISVPDR